MLKPSILKLVESYENFISHRSCAVFGCPNKDVGPSSYFTGLHTIPLCKKHDDLIDYFGIKNFTTVFNLDLDKIRMTLLLIYIHDTNLKEGE